MSNCEHAARRDPFVWPRQAGLLRWVAWIARRLAGALAAALLIGATGVAISTQAQETGAPPIETIRFAPGASEAVVSGSVIRGERALYAIGARSGQRMTLSLSSAEDNAAFQIYRPGAEAERRDYGVQVVGKALPGAEEGEDAKTWNGVLPETGTYIVSVGPTRANTTYKLTVAIR